MYNLITLKGDMCRRMRISRAYFMAGQQSCDTFKHGCLPINRA